MTNEKLREVAKEIINIAFDKNIWCKYSAITKEIYVFGSDDIYNFIVEEQETCAATFKNDTNADQMLNYVRNF